MATKISILEKDSVPVPEIDDFEDFEEEEIEDRELGCFTLGVALVIFSIPFFLAACWIIYSRNSQFNVIDTVTSSIRCSLCVYFESKRLIKALDAQHYIRRAQIKPTLG